MEKNLHHSQPDSIATVQIKPDYAPSEIYSTSEPPPAYMKNDRASVQVAKIIATTVVLCSVILGFFILASAYVTANSSCKQLEQELELLGEMADRFQPQQAVLQPEALVQENPSNNNQNQKPEEVEQSQKSSSPNENEESSNEINNSNQDDEKKIHFKLPLQLDFDDLAGALIEKNQRSKMNCIVEKKKAEQLVDHQSKVVNLPFGLNLTTDPRLEKITGERMAIFCESGSLQRANQDDEETEEVEDEDPAQNEATIMIQPVMIPIPPSHFQTHMAHVQTPQIHVQEHAMFQPPPPQQTFQYQPQPQRNVQYPPQPFSRVPPIHPMETMRPPMPPQVSQVVQVAQTQANDFPPANILKQIAEQIVAQKEREDMIQQQQQQRNQQEQIQEQRMRFPMGSQNSNNINEVIQMRIPMPEMILNHLTRLQSSHRLNGGGEVIVAVEQNDQSEGSNESSGEDQQVQGPSRTVVVQEQRSNPIEMNGRQSYARQMPVDIPEQMMKEQKVEEVEPEAEATEEVRPHYVQPRSVRNKREVENLLKGTKRVKRCACDCSC